MLHQSFKRGPPGKEAPLRFTTSKKYFKYYLSDHFLFAPCHWFESFFKRGPPGKEAPLRFTTSKKAYQNIIS